MPKVHQQKARKDYPNEGIKKGDTYFKWSLRFSKFGKGVTYRSATRPRSSQVTSSPFWQEVYLVQERIEDLSLDQANEGDLRDITGEIENIRDETQEKFDNMPEGFQQGHTGELLQERIDGLDCWISELECIDFSPLEDDPCDETCESLLEQIQACQYQG